MSNIPYIIHYCWFGGAAKPQLVLDCMASWRKFFPDWQIIEWNESNYDVNKIPYVAEAYAARKWAFVSDYARFDILYKYGGIYLDVDVEFLKPLPQEMLQLEAFTGFESSGLIAPGLIFGVTPQNPVVKELLDTYAAEHFEVKADGIYKTVNLHMAEALPDLRQNNTQQTVRGITVFPSEMFCGYDTDIREPDITPNTICRHLYLGSWSVPSTKMKLQNLLKKVVGKKAYKKLVLLKRSVQQRAEGGLCEYICSDLYRYYGSTGLLTFLRGFFFHPAFNYQFWLRCCQHGKLMRLVGLPVLKWKRTYGKINLGWKCKVGYGLYIGHNGPIVVNDNAVIGNNVNLSQFTTIGSNDGPAAEIGDNVYVGPNVCIVGHVKIGANATIGAGSVVTKDIPENATAAGNYAKVLNFNDPGRYIGRPWCIRSITREG